MAALLAEGTASEKQPDGGCQSEESEEEEEEEEETTFVFGILCLLGLTARTAAEMTEGGRTVEEEEEESGGAEGVKGLAVAVNGATEVVGGTEEGREGRAGSCGGTRADSWTEVNEESMAA